MKKIKNNHVFLNTNFITNFKPQLLTDFKNYKFFTNSNQIYCRNFFIYILVLKYKNNLFNKNNIYIKKFKRKVYTILRSPYRHKLARHQIGLNRYHINLSLKLNFKKNLLVKNSNNLLKFLRYLKNFNKLLESNIFFTNNISISFPFSYKNNFLINKYK